MAKKKMHDVFISYASEDRSSLVKPLALELRKRGLSVWYDEFELRVGKSLRESIEQGLASSRYGIVVFSPDFISKKWPKKELNGLFAKEMAGNKIRILPILHNLARGVLIKKLPIQADRVSLSSTLSISELCDSLIQVIKPELLKLDELKRRGFESSDAFIEAAEKEHPGYGFSVSVNSPDASGKAVSKKLEVSIVDPSAMKELPIVNVKFSGEEARKAVEFVKTGKPQTWKTGEFASIRSAIPFFPDLPPGSTFSVGPVMGAAPRPVRLECGSAKFEYMLMKLVRKGTEESEFEISSDSEPLKVSIVWPSSKRRKFTFNFSWIIGGYRASQCLELMRFIDAIAQHADIRVVDLKGELATVPFPSSGSRTIRDPFDENTRKLVSLCAQIEGHFKIPLVIKKRVSESDAENLRVLDGLLNGNEISAEAAWAFTLRKGSNTQIDQAVCDGDKLESLSRTIVLLYLNSASWETKFSATCIASVPIGATKPNMSSPFFAFSGHCIRSAHSWCRELFERLVGFHVVRSAH